MILRALTVLGALLFFVPQARAVTCTVQGTLKCAPTDYYYCDTDFFPDCSGRLPVNLDTKTGMSAPPVQLMRVTILSSTNAVLAKGHTNSLGFYSIPVNFPSNATCSGLSVKVRKDFIRAHESEALAAPRYRFHIIDQNGTTRQSSALQPCR